MNKNIYKSSKFKISMKEKNNSKIKIVGNSMEEIFEKYKNVFIKLKDL